MFLNKDDHKFYFLLLLSGWERHILYLFKFFVSLLAFPFPMKSSLLVDVFWAVLIVNIPMGQIICNYLSGQLGLKINIQKTKEMRIGARQQESLELHGEAVERVSEFTYLGNISNETGKTDEDITARLRKAQSTFSMLMPVWKAKCIRLQTKLRIFNTNVKSALLYGSETWISTKLRIKMCLRKILNIRWPMVISNENYGKGYNKGV